MAKTPRNHSTKPDAWVVSPSDRGRKSIKNGKVYLKHGEEFEIEIFNPLTDCVLADIKLNDSSISKNGLVIKPGQRFYLDCFIDDGKKLVFGAYEVESGPESEEIASENGKLEIFFYKESVVSINNWRTRFDRLIIERSQPAYYPSHMPSRVPNIWFGDSTASKSINTAPFGGTTENNLYARGGKFRSIGETSKSPLSGIETGRAEKGANSAQKFDEVDMEFESLYISSTSIQLLPESRKPAEASELSKQKEAPKNDAIELIKKLAVLKEAGILTEEEFSEKKAELLKRI